MNLKEVLEFRRSVRVYDAAQPIDAEKIKECLELATLAPNSSNMQLWEFYHVTDPLKLKELGVACLGQSAATTAPQMVVFVTRQGLYKSRSQQVLEFERGNIRRHSPADRQEKRIKDQEIYYQKVMPLLYVHFFGILGFLRKLLVSTIQLFRPMVLSVTENDTRIVVHKSCALAAQTFMIALANIGYDSCPMEGFDSRRVKKSLRLPADAEVNMIISVGIRKGTVGIRGDRFRVPFEQVYRSV